jgi:diguanylate cyclase
MVELGGGPNRAAPLSAREPLFLMTMKRRVYVASLSLVAVAALLGFALGGLSDYPLGIRLLYGPIASVLSLLAALALGSRRLALRRAELLGFAAAASLLVLHVGIALFDTPGEAASLRFAAFAPWIAAVFMLGFLMLDTRLALRAALALFLAMLLLAAASVYRRGLGSVGHVELNALTQQFVFANGFYMLLLFVLARAKEEYGKAEYRSMIMDELAHRDELTKVANRRYLIGACSREIERLKRRPRPLSLLIIDLDHFKLVNDNHGHAAGDEVLREVARILPGELRAGDDFGRIGGEEFVVLAYDSDARTGALLAERLREVLERSDWRALGLPAVTASFGVASYEPGDDFDSLLERADRALYRAKNEGRNSVRLAS